MNFYHTNKKIVIFHSVLNIAFLVLLSWILFSSHLAAMPIPKADAGILNLTSWDFDKDGTVRLEGDWQFYWQKFIAPEQKPLTEGTFIEVPKSWDGHQLNDNRNAPAHGYASYQLSISLPQNSPQLALKVIDIGEAFRLYVNGKLLHSGGETGTSQSMSKPAFASGVIFLPENIGNEINIVIHVSNYNYPRGGLWDYITLGEISAVQNLNIVHESSASNGQLTISCGVAAILPTKLTEPETLIAQADNALYASKAAGRNTTVAAS